MKHLILFFSLTFFSCSSQSEGCSKFKTGIFQHFNSKDNVLITRKDTIQIEKNTKTGVEYTGTIKWLSDCKYSLIYTDVSDHNRKHIIGTKFYVDIISTTDSTYTYSAYNDKQKIKGELIKIN